MLRLWLAHLAHKDTPPTLWSPDDGVVTPVKDAQCYRTQQQEEQAATLRIPHTPTSLPLCLPRPTPARRAIAALYKPGTPLDPPMQSYLVHKEGRLPDCELLRLLWDFVGRTQPIAAAAASTLFVDVGASTGMCSLEVLHTTDAQVLAIEHDDRGLFHLQSSLKSWLGGSDPERIRGRAATLRAAAAAYNGADVVGVAADVPVRTLDDLVQQADATMGRPRLLKIDVDGNECSVFKGGLSALNQTSCVVVQADHDLLETMDCNGLTIMKKLDELDFTPRYVYRGSFTNMSFNWRHSKKPKWNHNSIVACKQKVGLHGKDFMRHVLERTDYTMWGSVPTMKRYFERHSPSRVQRLDDRGVPVVPAPRDEAREWKIKRRPSAAELAARQVGV